MIFGERMLFRLGRTTNRMIFPGDYPHMICSYWGMCADLLFITSKHSFVFFVAIVRKIHVIHEIHEKNGIILLYVV